jgi:hypothetical protein
MAETPLVLRLKTINGLFDAVRKFGVPAPGLSVLFLALTEPRDLLFVVSAVSLDRKMMVCGDHSGYRGGQMLIVPLPSGPGHDIAIDIDLSLQDLDDALEVMDRLAATCGGIDAASGERLRIGEAEARSLFSRSFAAVFGQTHARMRVPHDDPALADLLKTQFDRPDDVAVFMNCFGEVWLCRADTLADFERRNAVMARLAPKYGVMGEDDFEEMDPATHEAYLREFDKTFKASPN